MKWFEIFGYVAAGTTLVTYSMRTMIPLRVAGIASNCLFIAYGFLAAIYPTLLLHLILLPLNSVRLYQMVQLIKRVREAARGDLSMDWLKPFMHKRTCRAGEVLFRKGDAAQEMFFTVAGRYRLHELGIEIAPGHMIGELGMITPDNRRTATFECVEDGELLTIGYHSVQQLMFQNPQFAFYFLRLATERLVRNIKRLEDQVAAQAQRLGEVPA